MSKKDNNRFDALFGAARNTQAVPEITSSLDDETAPQAIEPAPSSSLDCNVPSNHSENEVEERPLAKSKDPNCQRTTLYLAKPLHRQFKAAAATEGKEMSDIMEKLIQDWLHDRAND